MQDKIVGAPVNAVLPDEIRNYLANTYLGSNYHILRIWNVTSQVVAGTNWEFNMEVHDAKNDDTYIFRVTVWDQPWRDPRFIVRLFPLEYV